MTAVSPLPDSDMDELQGDNFRSTIDVVQTPDRGGMVELSNLPGPNMPEPPPSLADSRPPVGPPAGMKTSESTVESVNHTLHEENGKKGKKDKKGKKGKKDKKDKKGKKGKKGKGGDDEGVHMSADNFRSRIDVVQPPDRDMVELSNLPGPNLPEPPPSLADSRPPVGPPAGMKTSESTVESVNHTLHKYARRGDARRARILLGNMGSHAKKRINMLDKYGCTPLHYAVQYNHIDVIKLLLIDKLADVKSRDEKGRTPLHYAARYQEVDMYYGDYESDEGLSDTDGDIIVSDTAEDLHTQFSVINFLISKGADINALDNNDKTPLHHAAKKGNKVQTGELLSFRSAQCSVSLEAKNKNGQTALHVAVAANEVEVSKMLIDAGVMLRCKDEHDSTPLHTAASVGNTDIVHMLFKAGEKLDGCVTIQSMLTDKDKDGDTCLSISVENRHYADSHYEVVKLILEKGERYKGHHGADVNTPNNKRMCPLHLAASNGNVRIVRLLVEHNARIDVLNNEHATPLHLAAQGDHVQCVEFLVDSKAGIECKDEKNYTPLLLASACDNAPTVDMLIKKGADVTAVDKNNKTAIYLAAEEIQLDALEALLKYEDVKSMINVSDRHDDGPLHVAAKNGYLPIVQALLKNGADLDSKNKVKETPLQVAVRFGQTDIVRELMKQDKHAVHDKDETSETALHRAAVQGDAKLAGVLIEMGADIAARNSKSWSPLACASINGCVKTVIVLLDAGSPIDTTYRLKRTPLLLASLCGNTSVVGILIDRGADVKHRDDEGRNCLDLAIDNDNEETAEAIIKSKYWKEALRNHIIDRNTKRYDTPMRKLIRKMPDVAESVFNLCTVANNEHVDNEEYAITYNYEFLDDTYYIPKWIKKRSSDSGPSSGKVQNSGQEAPAAGLTTTDGATPGLPAVSTVPSLTVPLATATVATTTATASVTTATITQPVITATVTTSISGVKETVAQQDTGGSLFDDDIHLTHKDQPYTSDSGTFKRNHPLMIMVTSKRVDLLAHPLVTALLMHKWSKFARNYYYFHFTVYVVFLVFMTGYMLTTDPPYGQAKSCNDADTADFKQNLFARIGKYVIMTLVGWNLLIEVLQIYQARMNYFSWENLIDWITNITALLTVIDLESCQKSTGFRTDWQWNVGTVAIFLTWINLVLFMQRFPTFGIYVVMFQHILKTFFQFAMVFVLFIVAFAMAFYALLQNQPAFETIWQALIKTTVMMIGEFDYTDIFIDTSTPPVEHVNYKPVSYIMFVIFMVIMSTIIMNLLVGLAVDNIKEVQEQAELTRKAMLVELALDVERVVPNYFRRKFIKKRDKILPNDSVKIRLSKIFGLESYGRPVANINTALNPELLKKSVDKMKMKEMKASILNLEGMMKALLEAQTIRWQDIQINQSTAQGELL